eukprot:UN11355
MKITLRSIREPKPIVDHSIHVSVFLKFKHNKAAAFRPNVYLRHSTPCSSRLDVLRQPTSREQYDDYMGMRHTSCSFTITTALFIACAMTVSTSRPVLPPYTPC